MLEQGRTRPDGSSSGADPGRGPPVHGPGTPVHGPGTPVHGPGTLKLSRWRRLLLRLGLVPSPSPRDLVFHAFISYSHAADIRLARELQRDLQRFAKPWNQARALHVFRDEASLAVNPDLWQEIARALDASDFYVLLASPAAAESFWVNEEATRWLATKRSDHILLALTEGEIAWDNETGRLDPSRTNALPPALRDAFARQPFWIDLRWARSAETLSLDDPRYRDAVVSLAAPLHGMRKDQIAGEEVRQNRRTIRVARTAAAVLTTLTAAAIGLLVFALIELGVARTERDQARTQRDLAVSRELATQAEADLKSGIYDRAALLSIEAYRVSPTGEARDAMVQAVSATRGLTEQLVSGLPGGSPTINPAISALALSQDRQTLASVQADDTLRVWDLSAGFDEATLAVPFAGNDALLTPASTTNLEPIQSVAFSREGNTIAAGCADGRVALWRANPGDFPWQGLETLGLQQASQASSLQQQASQASNVQMQLESDDEVPTLTFGGGTQIDSVAFSPDGKELVSGDDSGHAVEWSTPDGRMLRRFAPVSGAVTGLVFRADGRVVATTSQGAVATWNASTGALTGNDTGSLVEGAGAPAASAAILNASGTLAAVNTSSGVALWDVDRHRVRRTLPAAAGTPLALSGDGASVAIGHQDGTVTLQAGAGGGGPLVLRGHQGAVSALALSADGSVLATGGGDGAVMIWNPAHVTALRAIPGPANASGALAMRTDGLAASDDPGQGVALWSSATQRLITTLPTSDPLDLQFSADGSELTSVGSDGRVVVWNVAARRPLRSFSVGPLSGNALGAGGGYLLADRSDTSALSTWDVSTARRLHVLKPRSACRSCSASQMAVSGNGSLIAITDDENSIQLFRAADGRQLHASEHEWNLWGRPPGYDTACGGNPADQTGQPGPAVGAVTLNSDGSLVAAGKENGAVIVWHTDNGQVVTCPSVRGYASGAVRALAFSPDGQTLAAGTDTGAIVLWDAATGRTFRNVVRSSGAPVVGLAFSRDGQSLAVQGRDGMIALYSPFPGGSGARNVAQRLCQVAGQNLTALDWTALVPDAPYHATCHDFGAAADATP